MLAPKIPKEAAINRVNLLVRYYASARDIVRNTPPGRIRGLIRAGLLELGWLGIVGIGVFFMCLAFYFSALRPSEARLQILRDNVAMHDKPGIKPGGIVGEGVDQAEQLAVFYRYFPVRSSVPVSLGRIYLAAANEGLSLDRADYKANRASAGKMTRYQLTLPIKGDYFKIQKFLVRVLKEVPSASLERVIFERKNIDDPSVDATVTLVLHLGPEP